MATKERWQTDHALIRACRGGEEAAWKRLILRYRRLIFSIPVAYRIPADESDEIFQRVTVKLFEHLEKIRRAESLPAWLAVTTRRECQGYFRGSRRFSPLDEESSEKLAEDPPEVLQGMHRIECEQTLQIAVEKMDATCRGLLSALYVEEPAPSYEELAARLGRPVGSLGPTRMRCLKKLRKLYLQLGGKEP